MVVPRPCFHHTYGAVGGIGVPNPGGISFSIRDHVRFYCTHGRRNVVAAEVFELGIGEIPDGSVARVLPVVLNDPL